MTAELELRHRDFLRTFAIFKDFHPNDLLLMARHLTERRFEREQVIFKEGDPGYSAFLVVFGEVAVLKGLPEGKYQPLATLKSGQMFGQVSLIDGQPRSATCVSVGRTLLLELEKQNFDEVFALGERFAFRLQDYFTRVMVKQVRQANERLAGLVRAAPGKKTRAELGELAEQMKDAMRSAREMGVDLDEVHYEIAEGQYREELHSRYVPPDRDKACEEIVRHSVAEAPGQDEAMTIALKMFSKPRKKTTVIQDVIAKDGTYSVTRPKK